jgi:hypothetical protein
VDEAASASRLRLHASSKTRNSASAQRKACLLQRKRDWRCRRGAVFYLSVFLAPVSHDGRSQMEAVPISFTVNNQNHTVTVDPRTPLLDVLREDLGLTGTKYGCGKANAPPAPCSSTTSPSIPA